MENVSILSMVIATLLPMAAGFIYYHKAVLGKAWMDSTGITEEKQKQAYTPLMFGISIVMSFLIAFFLLHHVNGPGHEEGFNTFKHGAFHGALVSLFVAIPVLFTNGLFEQRSIKTILIDALYWLVTFALMGGVLDAMNHFPNGAAG